MAIKIKGDISIIGTGVTLPEAYLRILCINNIDGTQDAKLMSFVSKEHYKNQKQIQLSQARIPIGFGDNLKLTPVKTFDLVLAHEEFKTQFEKNGFKVEIVDL